jgi:D-3-phosphoglycerate dehydrogenase / 2-oxoglutarate reductase
MLALCIGREYGMCMDLTYILDFDSTLVGVESLDELARLSLQNHPEREARLSQLHALTNQGMSGGLAFDESLSRRLKLFQANRNHLFELVDLLKEAITDSALEMEDWFEENADNIYIVSGGFADYIIPVAKELGIPASHVFANKFTYDGDGTVTGFDDSLLVSKAGGKAAQVEALELASPVIMVGDGFTDYEVRAKGAADEFWAFTQHVTRSSVVERADRVIESFEELEALAESIA